MSCKERAKRPCICGGDLETTLRNLGVFFLVGDLKDLARCSLPELRGQALFVIIERGR